MNLLSRLVHAYQRRARHKRHVIFRSRFDIDENTRVLDLGGHDGSNICGALEGTRARPENVYIADIDADAVAMAVERYGYQPVIVQESERLPFDDQFFDVVYCSSVIEHVTVPKSEIWELRSGKRFRELSLRRQKEFAGEIMRIGRQYFVQTPYRHFPIESHSWLPFIAWLPRRLLIPALRLTNLFWIKKTSPDWYLLDRRQMAQLFDGAEIVRERSFALTKSIMAVRTAAPGIRGEGR